MTARWRLALSLGCYRHSWNCEQNREELSHLPSSVKEFRSAYYERQRFCTDSIDSILNEPSANHCVWPAMNAVGSVTPVADGDVRIDFVTHAGPVDCTLKKASRARGGERRDPSRCRASAERYRRSRQAADRLGWSACFG
jgi:hypothetical protein